MQVSATSRGKSPLLDLKQLGLGSGEFLILFPVCFVMEEVAFRGMLDAHLQPHSPSAKGGWISAAVVSTLWGLWHLPLSNLAPLEIAALIAVHLVIGVPLSFQRQPVAAGRKPCSDRCLVQVPETRRFRDVPFEEPISARLSACQPGDPSNGDRGDSGLPNRFPVTSGRRIGLAIESARGRTCAFAATSRSAKSGPA